TQPHLTLGNEAGSIQVKGILAAPHTGKKRGRGRPRKNPKPTEDAGGQNEVILKVESGSTSKDKDPPGLVEPLREIDANPKIPASDPTSAEDIRVTEHDVTPVEQGNILLIPSEPSENLTGEANQKPVGKAPNSQSPILKGKVKYRVGLSRKA